MAYWKAWEVEPGNHRSSLDLAVEIAKEKKLGFAEVEVISYAQREPERFIEDLTRRLDQDGLEFRETKGKR